MRNIFKSDIVTTGLAIFSMLFGAGNLMYPLKVGMNSGDQLVFGLGGFLFTAVLLPIMGFIGMILFNGNYDSFFNRLGKPVGPIFIAVCMLIIGPIIAIPRITTLSHIMMAPFLPSGFLTVITPWSSFIFSLIFLGITFLATYRESKIMSLLGYIISPLLLICLAIIIIKGILTGSSAPTPINLDSPITTFKNSLLLGYETLDLLGALFFSSIVLGILKNIFDTSIHNNPHQLALIGLKASLIGVSLLGLVYVGMGIIGSYHGTGFEFANAGQLFKEIAFKILGPRGALVIATAVLMACLSTSIALSAVVAEYVQSDLCRNHIGFVPALVLVLLSCIPLSTAGLDQVLALTGGVIVYVGYPTLITLTVMNIAHKLFNIRMIKLPVLAIFIVTLILYYGK